MLYKLDQLYIKLKSDSEPIRVEWGNIFGLFSLENHRSDRLPDIALTASIAPRHVQPTDGEVIWENGVIVKRCDQSIWWLSLPCEAEVRLEIPADAPLRADIYFPPHLDINLAIALLEDVTTAALAPLLRRHGIFTLHGFGVGVHFNQQNGPMLGVILIGRSGSGKTTTGMGMVFNGGVYYANDNVLLKKEGDQILLLPGWGTIDLTVDSASRLAPSRLPTLALLDDLPRSPLNGKLRLLPKQIKSTLHDPIKVLAILLPSLGSHASTQLVPELGSITMARLMEESIDVWDRETFADQIEMLNQLGQQAPGLTLNLGQEPVEYRSLITDIIKKRGL